MVNDLYGSVPYHLETKLDGGPGEDTGVEYPFNVCSDLAADQRRASAAPGGWHIIESLKIAVELTLLREGQQEWLTAIDTHWRYLLRRPAQHILVAEEVPGSEQAKSPPVKFRSSPGG